MRVLLPLAVLVGTVLINACGGSSTQDETATDLWQVSADQASTAPLTQTSGPALAQYVKYGLYANTTADGGEAVPAPVQPGVSDTNLITPGVDEADRVKFSDNLLYVSGRDFATDKAYLKRWQRGADSSLTPLPPLALAESLQRINGLYIDDGQLTVLGDDQQGYVGLLTTPADNINGKITVQLFEQDNAVYQLQFEGALIDSRRTEDALWLVSHYQPHAAGLLSYAVTDADKRHNMAVLQAASLTALLPRRWLNAAAAEPLVSAEQCYLPADVQSHEGSANMVVITRISTSAPYQTQSSCIVGAVDNLYMSAENLYLHGYSDNQTVLHKFTLTDSSSAYQATGVVSGAISGSQSAFMLYEKQQYLMLLTTDQTTVDQHYFYVLQQQDDQLAQVAVLPDGSQPGSMIGKPGEAIYGVRFTGDRAYVVTFERTDPLYTLDISNPAQPAVIGELEIPGYSAYLHSLTDDLLWGLGQQIVFDEQGEPIWDSAGAKLALFDVSTDDAMLLDELLFSGQFSPLEYQHHSLTVQQHAANTRLALPLSRFDDSLGDKVSLLMLDIAHNGIMQKTAELRPDYNQYADSWGARAVLVNDDIYFVVGDKVYHSVWQQPEQLIAEY
ncbi:MAG TPA: beta-propeller domain-containing protein [Rheinheimera sp.]|nr:beta-propeller domain-containing protein [Rheinheimera sp.]